MAMVSLTNNQRGPRGHGDFMLAPGEIGEFELSDTDIETIKAGGMLDISAAGKPAKKPVKATDAAPASSPVPPLTSLEADLLRDQLLEMGIEANPDWDVARLQKELDAALAA